jgi:hypothetical protein
VSSVAGSPEARVDQGQASKGKRRYEQSSDGERGFNITKSSHGSAFRPDRQVRANGEHEAEYLNSQTGKHKTVARGSGFEDTNCTQNEQPSRYEKENAGYFHKV